MDRPEDWPWSSYAVYVEPLGLVGWQAIEGRYPIDRYGQGWDD
ncbi:hypothetical protein [Thermoflexus sp.]|nr:hypothetical protein [Thermoflexus sp.]